MLHLIITLTGQRFMHQSHRTPIPGDLICHHDRNVWDKTAPTRQTHPDDIIYRRRLIHPKPERPANPAQ